MLLAVHADGSLVASAVAAAARTLSTLWSVPATGGPRGPVAQVRAGQGCTWAAAAALFWRHLAHRCECGYGVHTFA